MPSAPSTPTVEEALDAVATTLYNQNEAYLHALRTNGLVPLRETLTESLEAHEEARADIAIEPVTRRALWDAVRRYRRTTLDSVWRPLRSRLETLNLGTLLRDQRRSMRSVRMSLADDVPETITRPEPDDLYSSSDADGWTTWAGKALIRGWRHASQLTGAVDSPEQTIPLSDLVEHYATERLPQTQAPALDAAEQRMVQWMARLEREAVAWTHRLLEIERLLDRPAFHSPEEEVTIPPPTEDPTSGVMEPDVEALREEVAERAEALHQCLDDGRSLQLDDAEAALDDAVETTLTALRESAKRADTFMGDPSSRTPSRSVRRAQKKRRTRVNQWPDWFDEAAQRLTFLDTLATLHDDLADQHDALVRDVLEAGLAPVRAATSTSTEQLRELRDEIDRLLDSPEPGDELDLIQAFDHHVEEGTSVIEQSLLTPLQECGPRRASQAVVASHRETVTELLAEQPEGFVLHTLVAPDTEPVAPTEPYTLEWRNGCQEVLDEILFDAWENALSPLLETVDQTTERATEVRAVVEFNLEAAKEELEDLRGARREKKTEHTFVENARELALGGLDRALDLLAAETDRFSGAAGPMLRQTWTASVTTWTELHDRVRAAGQTRAHVLRLQGQMVRGTRWLATTTTRQVRATTTQLRRTLHRVQRQAQRLVRLGHAAVGTQPVDEAALRETVDTLSTVDAVLADLPLVYRRLFSFRPVQNDDLLVARETDRAAVERHADRWTKGLTSALVITGPAGSGRTSLLNVMRKTAFRTAQRHTIELTERITSEAAFAQKVAQALNLPLEVDGNRSLDAVADYLQDQPVPDRLRVCFIEQFEHVFHRRVGGTTLGARILGFLSKTDTRVLWIATTTDEAWQFVEASEPAAARLLTHHTLDPLDRTELEELIMTRHRRSGLPLVFETPDESTHPILSRRLRSITDEERRQALLRTEYFDHLHDVCGQNVMLALFYWFRSVSLAPDETTLHVQPLSPVSFDILDTLPLPHSFALKALLEHGTLTVAELADVLGVPSSTSRSLLETLGNALIIAPADRVEGPGVFQFASVEYETRYRIRPLLIHPVTRFLRSRNIVH